MLQTADRPTFRGSLIYASGILFSTDTASMTVGETYPASLYFTAKSRAVEGLSIKDWQAKSAKRFWCLFIFTNNAALWRDYGFCEDKGST